MPTNSSQLSTKIYIARHGQTFWNIQKLYQSWGNSDLTQVGINQAVAMGKFLNNANIQKIYYSPLQRVIQTKNLILDQFEEQQKILIRSQTSDDRLKECNYGELEGKSELTLHNNLVKIGINRNLAETKLNWQFPNGENYNQVFDRVQEFVNKNLHDVMLSNLRGGSILIVGHCGTTRCLWAILNDIPRIEAMGYKPNNGELICYDIESKLCEIINFNNNI